MSIINISLDNILNILDFLSPRDIVSIRGVCKYFFNISKCEYLWRSVDIGQFGTNKMSNVIKVFQSMFGAEKIGITNKIIISKPIARFTDNDFNEIYDLFPNVRHFILEVDAPKKHFLTEENYINRFDTRNTISTKVLQVIQNWPLETVRFLGNAAFNVKQDYFIHFFKALPQLKEFSCDFDVAYSKSWGNAWSIDPVVPAIEIYGNVSIVTSALNHCKALNTLRAPIVELRKHMIDDLMKEENINLRHLAITLQPFSSVTVAEKLAEFFGNLETLQIDFCWGDWRDDLSHIGTFISKLPCIREVVFSVSDMFNYVNINIHSETLRNIRFAHSRDPQYRPYLENMSFKCPRLEKIEFNSMELYRIKFNDMHSLKSVIFNDCECLGRFDQDKLMSDCPDIKIVKINTD